MLRAAIVVLVLVAGCGDDEGGAPDMSVPLDMFSGDMVVLPPECDVFMNTGCPSGEKCTVGTQNGTPRDLCFAVAANPVGEFAACSFTVPDANGRAGDNCAVGLVCLDYPGDGPHCRRPCYERAHCSAGDACVFPTATSTPRTTDAGDTETLRGCAHDDGCDPVAQDVCTGGKGCWLSPADDVGRIGVCLTNVKPGMAGADCKAQAECAPGFRCNGLGFCRRYCYFDLPDGGAAGSGACPANEGLCDRFSFSGPVYGICGSE
jgi:hypothetical protein